MKFFNWFNKGKKKARTAIFATALSFAVACTDMAKKANIQLKENKIILILENAGSKAYRILEKAQENVEFGTLKDVKESIAEMDSLNKEYDDFFYSHEIDEDKLLKNGFTDYQIILIKGFQNNFVKAREELGYIEYKMEHNK